MDFGRGDELGEGGSQWEATRLPFLAGGALVSSQAANTARISWRLSGSAIHVASADGRRSRSRRTYAVSRQTTAAVPTAGMSSAVGCTVKISLQHRNITGRRQMPDVRVLATGGGQGEALWLQYMQQKGYALCILVVVPRARHP